MLYKDAPNISYCQKNIELNYKRNEGEARVHYKLIKYKMMGEYKIL